ncbi:MAG TPA: hypothetical protein VGF04_09590 [Solirubrobacterales bacterium]|jgi:hypothetical protein
MAAKDERRMVFDVRGRRKHVIRVVYAILALLMGASLFLTVGPFNVGELVGTGGSKSAGQVLEEQAERIEGRLAKNPKDEALLLALARARINAGNAEVEVDPTTGAKVVSPEAKADFETGLDAWARYLKVAGSEASSSGAQLVAATYISLAEAGGGDLGDIETSLRRAAETQEIVAKARPSLGSLSTLAIYQYFANDFAAGDRAAREAAAKATQKSEAKGIEKQLAAYRKRGKKWEKQRKEIAKQERKSGKEKLENPLGGLSGSAGTTLTP